MVLDRNLYDPISPERSDRKPDRIVVVKLAVIGGPYFYDGCVVANAMSRAVGDLEMMRGGGAVSGGNVGITACISHCGSGGAESMAGMWSQMSGYETRVYAGVSKERVLDERPDMLIVFPGEPKAFSIMQSARLRGITVWEVFGPV